MIRPSSLPALAACPCFASDPDAGIDAKEAGTRRHQAIEGYLRDEPTWADSLTEEEVDAVKWAGLYVEQHAPTARYPLEIEQRGEFWGPDFESYSGTPDIYCGPVLFDAKGRQVDAYREQMAAYVLMRNHEEVDVHVLYLTVKRVHRFRLTRAEAEAIVFPIITSALDPARTPRLNDWCDWCIHRRDCSAVLGAVNEVVANRPDWGLETYHSSEIQSPEEMGKALTLAKRLKKWCEAVEWAAKEMAIKDGKIPHGWELYSNSGRRWCEDAEAAFPLLGMPQSEFLAACDIRWNTPKGQPDRKGIVERFAAVHRCSKAQAERQIEARLGSLLKRKPSADALRAANTDDPESAE